MIAKEDVTELSKTEFQDFIKENKLTIVDFYAEWCMPCVMMAPVLESVAGNNKEVKAGKLNIEDAEELARVYGISSIPCLIFFKGGKEVDRIIGAVSESIIEDKIKANK